MNSKNKILIGSVIGIIACLTIIFLPKLSGNNDKSPDLPDNQVISETNENEISSQNVKEVAPTQAPVQAEVAPTQAPVQAETAVVQYHFRNDELLTNHYNKHGIEMGFASKELYEAAASNVINNPAALSKVEAEDGDYVFYVEATNEFVVLSLDGYIRTYFLPDRGKSYYDKQ